MDKRYIAKRLKSIIEDFQIEYPIDLNNTCTQFGINLVGRNLDKEGYFAKKAYKKFIIYRNNLTPTRKKFVIAHELGHYFLHDDQVLQICSGIRETLNKYDTIADAETEANAFASELLVPEFKLMIHLPQKEFLTFDAILSIAGNFKSSPTVTAIRCVESSKTQSEVLVCYQNGYRKWVTSGDYINFNTISGTIPPDSIAARVTDSDKRLLVGDNTHVWDGFSGTVHEECFKVNNNYYLVLLSGTRDN